MRADPGHGSSLPAALARTLLDGARSDAAAAVAPPEHAAALPRITAKDVRVRLLAAHLADTRPGAARDEGVGTTDEEGWWQAAIALIPDLLDDPGQRIHQETAAFLRAHAVPSAAHRHP